jgi:FkbM family methyltransferase
MLKTREIPGPLGPFVIPTEPEKTSEVVEYLTRQVFDGEYDFPQLAPPHAMSPKTPLVVLDVGAGWGAFTVWALARWFGCRVFAYEPHAAAARFFEVNSTRALERLPDVTLDRASTVNLVEAAVSCDPNALYWCGEDWGAGRTYDQAEGRRVRVVHPRELPECDVLKADCEGAEEDIMNEYPHFANPRLRWLLLEFHDPSKRAIINRVAKSHGFTRVREEPEPATYGVSLWMR